VQSIYPYAFVQGAKAKVVAPFLLTFKLKKTMTQEEILEEVTKCKESTYYFATKYLMVKNHKGEMVNFKTSLSEDDFNLMIVENERIRYNNKHKKP
jgi:hypothetical protein